jgi:hypothetical protein
MLESGRRAIRSPEEAAQYEGGKYNALAKAASGISRDVQEEIQRHQQEQKANDRVIAAADVSETAAELKGLRIKADVERWSEDRYLEEVEVLLEAFPERLQNISELSRKQMSIAYQGRVREWRAESQVEALKVRTDRTVERFDSSWNKLEEMRDYHGQLMMLEVIKSGEGPKILSDAQIEQKTREVEGKITAQSLLGEYADQKKKGTEQKWLETLVDKHTPETMEAFHVLRKQHDAITKQQEIEQKQEKALATFEVWDNITATTTTEELIEHFNRLELDSDATLKEWVRKRDALKDADDIMKSDYVDPYDTKSRKALDSIVRNMADDGEGRVIAAMEIAQTKRIAPKYLDLYFSQAAHTPSMFIDGALNYLKYKQIVGDVPLGIHGDVLTKYEKFISTYDMGGDALQAAQATLAYYEGIDKDEVQFREKSYDDPTFGSEGKSPEELVLSELNSKLLEKPGFYRDSTWWKPNDVPEFPPEMQHYIQQQGKTIYGVGGNVEETAQLLFESILNSGWHVSDVNKGVKSGEQTLTTKWMKGDLLPRERTRQELASWAKDNEFAVSKAGGMNIVPDPERLELYQYRERIDGKMGYTVRQDGFLLLDPETMLPITWTPSWKDNAE